MKKYIFNISFLLFSTVLFAQNNEVLLDSANTAYAHNKFDVAINYYERIVTNGFESPELYYNLGNAHYKSQHLALAILNYEKAKKLSPDDEDINYNLKLAGKKLVDKIEPLPQLFIKNWWNSFLLFFSPKTWSVIYIAFIWLGFAGFMIYLISRNRSVKQFCFIAGIAAFILSFFFFFVASNSNATSSSHNEGIILSSTVNIKGSPSDQGTNLFVLHEGTKVKIQQSNGDWIEVKIPNGNTGWIKSADLAVI
jgi:tetratricopeptide (TPR) repeat protein